MADKSINKETQKEESKNVRIVPEGGYDFLAKDKNEEIAPIKITPAQSQHLKDWKWYEYEDGSGHLESPAGDSYYEYTMNPFGLDYRDPVTKEWEPLVNDSHSLAELQMKWEEKVVTMVEKQPLEKKQLIKTDKLWIDMNDGKVMEENTGHTLSLKEAAFVEDLKNGQVILKGKTYGQKVETSLSSEEFALGTQFQFSKEVVEAAVQRKKEIYQEQHLKQVERS